MTESNGRRADQPEPLSDDVEQALTSAADVESAGRSCIVIIALAIVTLVLLGIWVLYTTS